MTRLADLPLSLRLLKECHAILLSGVRGEEKIPGELRRNLNWIGSPNGTLADAAFVPPPEHDLADALGAWEKYIHDPRRSCLSSSDLRYCTTSSRPSTPFLDGNGRLGRVFVTLHLLEQQRLTAPLLYLSAHLERNRDTYYQRLQAVRETGAVQEWLRFFLQGVSTQATDAVERAEELIDLRENFRSRLRGRRSRAIEVVDLLMGNPVVSVRFVVNHLGITPQGASLLASADRRGHPQRTKHRAGQASTIRVPGSVAGAAPLTAAIRRASRGARQELALRSGDAVHPRRPTGRGRPPTGTADGAALLGQRVLRLRDHRDAVTPAKADPPRIVLGDEGEAR